jgi:UDP-N-acetylmuramoyl-L-alanyl-D-glutamate--2,6-diaminopimelate ligase
MFKNLGTLGKNIHEFSGITADSREVKRNFVFVAVRGKTNDGHQFIESAIKNGATAIIGEEDLNYPNYVKVEDSREVWGELASEFYSRPSDKLKIIGVTGTKGKTTTVHLIHYILTKLGKKAGLISSISVPGLHVTSPDPIFLQKTLKEFVDRGYEFAVIEVSSHGIDQKRIAGVKFDVGVLTNIAPEHLDYHKTFAEYKRVKMSFIESCKMKVISPKSTDIKILPGEFNNINAETAVEVVEKLGFGRKEALEALKSFKLPEGRLEEIENNLGIKIFVDFAHTPDSLEAVLKYLRTQTSKKLIIVFGCAGERDTYKRSKMGKIASDLADKVILTAEDPRSEKVEDIIGQIKSGITQKKAEIYEEPDRRKAIKLAIDWTKRGDLVGIFGKGHEKSINLDGFHEIPWSDQKIVREYIIDK